MFLKSLKTFLLSNTNYFFPKCENNQKGLTLPSIYYSLQLRKDKIQIVNVVGHKKKTPCANVFA